MQLKTFKWDQDADGIVTLTWDDPGRTMNVLSSQAIADLSAAVEKIASDSAIKAGIITSGKANGFCAGAALDEMESQASGSGSKAKTEEEKIAERFQGIMRFHTLFRRLETCGKPMVAAINGFALGGGLEVTLACHYRIVADNPRIQLGLPESKVGLLPGGGGTQRLPRLMGPAEALPIILQGSSLDPHMALAKKVVNKVVPAEILIAEAKRWIREMPSAVQPWDQKGYKVPNGPHSEGGSTTFTMANALYRKSSFNNYPAQRFILSCVYEGLQVPIDAGLRIEARYFAKLMMLPESRNMIRSLFLSMQDLGKGARRPKDVEPTQVKKLGVLGAGMMGAGIAYVSAQAGMEVVLLDRDMPSAEKGKAHSEKLLDGQIAKGRSTEEKKQALLARIKPTASYGDLKGCDLVIEAVFEDRAIKADVTKKTEVQLGPKAVFGSNTSTLPITGLAEASERPENFIGIHFFSPVDRMQLVEIIMGKKTSPYALAMAIDYVKQIKKTPIVVNDSRGFYTSRCFGTYVAEGQEMLAEGIAPAIVDNVGRMTGMPRGPLELSDDVALDLAYKVREATKKDLGDKYEAGPSDALIETMVQKLGRYGRKNGKGFYDYPSDPKGKKTLWPGLKDLIKIKVSRSSPELVEELKKRFLYRQAIEAARCFEENVVTDPREADVGAILGWGFAPYSGGPLSIIDTVGPRKFVEECDRLAQKYGKRFMPGKLLRDMAANDETFYGRFGAKKAA